MAANDLGPGSTYWTMEAENKGLIPRCAPIFQSFRHFNAELLYTSKMELLKRQKFHSRTCYIELCTKYVGVRLSWTLLGDT